MKRSWPTVRVVERRQVREGERRKAPTRQRGDAARGLFLANYRLLPSGSDVVRQIAKHALER
jgi:hypothetical protein